MSCYRLAPTKAARFEPILMRLAKEFEVGYVSPTIVRFEPQCFRAIRCTRPMVYGVNNTPRCRMRHQVQLGEGAPGWRGRMPTDRYEPISASPTPARAHPRSR